MGFTRDLLGTYSGLTREMMRPDLETRCGAKNDIICKLTSASDIVSKAEFEQLWATATVKTEA